MSKKYYLKTFGCQANEADSERLMAFFEKQGYQMINNAEKAELVIINTCSVRESAENRVFGLVNKLAKTKELREKKKGQKQKIILTGCIVGSGKGERKRYSLSQLKQKLPAVDRFKTIEELIGNTKILPKRKESTSALVPIMEGCNHFCSYCVVPYARGKEISRPFDEIVCEVEELVRRGVKEITLLGQNVNSYCYDDTYHRNRRKLGFADLLEKLHEISGLKKISFLTSNPWDLTDDIIEAMLLPKIDRYLHLPVQSGDGKILKKMNRPYTPLQYIKLVKKIRKRVFDISIGTDIIVGFPGETKKQFQNTVRLCQKIGFTKAYIAKYSPRPGTAAFKLKDDIFPAEKKRRWQILEKLINRKQAN